MIHRIVTLVWLMCSTSAVNVPVTITEVTTTTVKFNSYVWSMISHPDKSHLLVVTDRFAVWTFDPKTKQKILIAGSTSDGYQEGKEGNARFDDPAGSAHFNESTIIVTDYNNYCVRLVNLETHLTERYAGVCKSGGYKDGNRLSAQFNWVWGITRIEDDFYICEPGGGKIRRISRNTVSTLVSVTNLYIGITSVGSKLIYDMSHGLGEYDVSTNTNKILTGTTSSGSTDGSLSSARFSSPLDVVALTDKILLVADNGNNAVRIVDQNKQTVSTITVSTSPRSILLYNGDVYVGLDGGKIVKFPINQLPAADTGNITCNSDLNKTLSSTDFSVLFKPAVIQSSYIECRNCPSVQNISIGVHQFIYTYWNKLWKVQKICNQTVTVNAVTGKLICPQNLNATLPQSSTRITVRLPQADVNGTRFQCMACPRSQLLSEGTHVISHVYQDPLTNVNLTCRYKVNVENPLICHNETKHLYLLPNQTSTGQLTVGNCKLKLEPGLTEFELWDGCYQDYKVHEWIKLKRQAFLEAEYLFDCSSLSKLSISIIKSDAKQHTKYLQKYCPDCKVGVSSPEIKCLQDKLILVWETGVTGTQEVSPFDMECQLEKPLVQFHDDYPEMDISVINTKPTVASPVRLDSGLYLKIDVRTSCLEKGYVYNQWKDLCEKMTVIPAAPICPKNMKLILPHNINELNFTLPQPQVNETRLHCTNCPIDVQMLDEGIHNVTFTYLDLFYNTTTSCNYTINVVKQPPPKYQPIAAVPHCPSNMKLTLPYNIEELNLTLPQPQVNESRLNCLNCPDKVQMLKEGVHDVTFKYMDNFYNTTTSCNYTITVVKQLPLKCSNETRRLFVQTGRKNTDLIKIGDTGFGISFDIGIHKVNVRDDCFITYIVNEMSKMERRVELQAEYTVKCSTLKSVSLSVIDSQLLVHTQYLRKYCPVCQINSSPNPDMSCTNDTLISTWKTDVSGDNQMQSDNIKKKLHTALIEFQNKYPVMDITVITTLPRIVAPVKDSAGLNLRVIVKTTCVDKGFVYNKQYDVCERADE